MRGRRGIIRGRGRSREKEEGQKDNVILRNKKRTRASWSVFRKAMTAACEWQDGGGERGFYRRENGRKYRHALFTARTDLLLEGGGLTGVQPVGRRVDENAAG